MEDLLLILNDTVPNETDQSSSLRKQAFQLLTSLKSTSPSNLSTTLYTLLTQVIKPLFSKSQHKSITSTGRKSQFPPPQLPNRFGTDSIFEPPPIWKTTWTIPLLIFILGSYNNISESNQKSTVEEHFHLLVPPLLHLIDDSDIPYKSRGCNCLEILSNLLIHIRSNILKRTGLAEVFIDALKGCFHYLPTLTPEDESLGLLTSLYPAYLALVRARFITIEEFISPTHKSTTHSNHKSQTSHDEEIITLTIPTSKSTSTSNINNRKPQTDQPQPQPIPTPTQISTDLTLRTTHLTILLRSSVLYTLTHLRTNPSSSSPSISISTSTITTSSIPLTTFLLTQIPLLLSQLHISASAHLQSIIPFLVTTISDPFATAAPSIMRAGVDALIGVVQVCWVRVRERWWSECLRGLVAAWLNLEDELGDVRLGDEERKKEIIGIMGRVRIAVSLLRDVVGEEFVRAQEKLCLEEGELEGLFGGLDKKGDER